MARTIFTPSADKEYWRLPEQVRRSVQDLLDGEFATHPFAPQFRTRKLHKPFTGYRLRLGEYRILFEFNGRILLIYRVRHRKDAYQEFAE